MIADAAAFSTRTKPLEEEQNEDQKMEGAKIKEPPEKASITAYRSAARSRTDPTHTFGGFFQSLGLDMDCSRPAQQMSRTPPGRRRAAPPRTTADWPRTMGARAKGARRAAGSPSLNRPARPPQRVHFSCTGALGLGHSREYDVFFCCQSRPSRIHRQTLYLNRNLFLSALPQRECETLSVWDIRFWTRLARAIIVSSRQGG